MTDNSLQTWYLMKHGDGTVFGPVNLGQIKEWAHAAQVSPLDKLSSDEQTWTKAPMHPELEMDWLVQVSPDHFYGPTTLSAVREFIEMGEINGDTIIINCRDGSERQIREIEGLMEGVTNQPEQRQEPVRTGIRVSLQQRIRDLEGSLLEERRALEVAEERYSRLEAKFIELTGKAPDFF